MAVASLILVEPSLPGNVGAAIRVAANFGVPRIDLVRTGVDPNDPEALNWACGGENRVQIRAWRSLSEAGAGYTTLAASASGRGRHNLPVLAPHEAVPLIVDRGRHATALVFGSESRGLRKEDLDRCDLIIRVPTEPEFPVLNLAQAVAILVAEVRLATGPPDHLTPAPAAQESVDGLMEHLETSLTTIGFLDPQNPQRILRKLRRIFGRAGITENEVCIVRGMCRQMEWAAGARPGRFLRDTPDESE